ncbi:DUF3489 domain-containing protein [Aliiroseovarius sp. YM-037]|uniref:DUF3489 domain-containing protein n=1 Tax=Aliiroseovarius sp. YM-037 TaxID=3341728 RepID=UPI003A7F90DC
MTKQANKKTNSAVRITKKDQLIKLLGSKAGLDIKALSEKLGWQQHTTRAALSGLRKAGFEIAAQKPAKGGMSKYRVVSAPKPLIDMPTVEAAHAA